MTIKLTQEKFIKLMNNVTGHSKNFIKENTRIQGIDMDVYVFSVGEFSYHSWSKESKYIYTQGFLNGCCVISFYHDFDTLTHDRDRDEKDRIKDIEYLLENR